MSINYRLLALSFFARSRPELYDFIHPHGPLSRFSQVALNPQPLPPHELGSLGLGPSPEPWAYESGAAIAQEVIHTLWLADRLGADWKAMSDDLDNWCPVGVPLHPPKLQWWRWPIPEPVPHPNWLVDFHLGFAARVAVASVEFEGTRLGESLKKAIDRSVAFIEQQATGLDSCLSTAHNDMT